MMDSVQKGVNWVPLSPLARPNISVFSLKVENFLRENILLLLLLLLIGVGDVPLNPTCYLHSFFNGGFSVLPDPLGVR